MPYSTCPSLSLYHRLPSQNTSTGAVLVLNQLPPPTPPCWQRLEAMDHLAPTWVPPTRTWPRVPANLREPPGLVSDPFLHDRPPGGSRGAAGLGAGTWGATLGSLGEAPRPRQLLGSQSQDLEEREDPRGKLSALEPSAPLAPTSCAGGHLEGAHKTLF